MTGREAESVFGVDLDTSSAMDAWIDRFYRITEGRPDWLDPEDDIISMNFAEFINQVTSGLVTLDIDVRLPDTPRGRYLQEVADYALKSIDETVSAALGNVGVMYKANGETVDYVMPGNYLITDANSNREPLGCIFLEKKKIGRKWYTKYEWHRYEMDGNRKLYRITNVCYGSDSERGRGKQCPLASVPDWSRLEPDAYLEYIERPLFGFYRNPKPNFMDRSSPLGLPLWANCINELRDLDIAWSRKSTEVQDSKHMTFVPEQAVMYAKQNGLTLPRFLKGLQTTNGTIGGEIHEHVAALLTDQRIQDINATLAMISTKCGFDQGFFVLDEKTGQITATQVEADDQSTIRTIKNLRDPLRSAFEDMLYAASKFADLYTDLPAESWTNSISELRENITFNWGDITYNYEEDKASWWKYRVQGDVPAWMYYEKFEGMSEDEAKAMIEEAKIKEPTLFGEEE